MNDYEESVYARRLFRDAHAEDAPWSSRSAIRSESRHDRDGVFERLNLPLTVTGVVAALYLFGHIVAAWMHSV